MDDADDTRIDALGDESDALAALLAGESFVAFGRLGRSVAGADAEREFWVLRAHEALAGLLVLDLAQRPGVELTLAIVPEHRGRGHARRLLAFAEARARALGRHWLLAVIDAANRPALGLFASSGFRRQDGGPRGHVSYHRELGAP